MTGSFAAFAYNMSIYNFTRLASAVAVMVTTNLLKVRPRTAHTLPPHPVPRRCLTRCLTDLYRCLTRSIRPCLTQVLLITAAAVVEGIRDPINWIGISIFFASVIAYAYLSYQAKQTAKKTATAATAPEAKPTETSNLVTK